MSALLGEDAILLAQPSQLLPLGGRQTGTAPLRSARARSTHCRKADSVRSNSRDGADRLPSSNTSRTAPARNSSLNCRRDRRRVVAAIRDIVSPFGTCPRDRIKPRRACRGDQWPDEFRLSRAPLRLDGSGHGRWLLQRARMNWLESLGLVRQLLTFVFSEQRDGSCSSSAP